MSTLTQFSGLQNEDAAATSGFLGLPMLAVRNDGKAVSTSANGDFSALQTDSVGRLLVTGEVSAATTPAPSYPLFTRSSSYSSRVTTSNGNPHVLWPNPITVSGLTAFTSTARGGYFVLADKKTGSITRGTTMYVIPLYNTTTLLSVEFPSPMRFDTGVGVYYMSTAELDTLFNTSNITQTLVTGSASGTAGIFLRTV